MPVPFKICTELLLFAGAVVVCRNNGLSVLEGRWNGLKQGDAWGIHPENLTPEMIAHIEYFSAQVEDLLCTGAFTSEGDDGYPVEDHIFELYETIFRNSLNGEHS